MIPYNGGLTFAMKPAAAVEVLVWALLAWAGASWMRVYRPMALADDSYQYLNVAENFSQGRGLTTSLIHFDAERSHGRIPAPLTTFPPGYPAVIAMAGLGGDFEAAARVLSGFCYAGTAALLVWALMLTGATALVRQALMLLFVTNAAALDYATSVLTEPLYILLSTGAVVGLIAAERAKRAPVLWAVLAYSAAGLAYWVRYAGLFLIIAVAGYALLQLAVERSRLRAALFAASLIPAALAASLMWRNVVTVGTWKGGNDLTVHNSLKHVTAEYVRAQLHLLLGGHAVVIGVWECLLLVGGLGVAVLGLAAVCKGAWSTPDSAAVLVALCVAVYSAGLVYAGLRTVISFGTRMFLPMLPLYVLLLGITVRWFTARLPVGSPWMKAALLLVAVAYAGVNARDLNLPFTPAPHAILAAWYAQPTSDGQPLVEWVESHIGAGDVILATDGQATGYLLHRPTISMVGSHFSPVRWECDEVLQQMRRFQSNYVILYTPAAIPDDGFLWGESRFVDAAVSGQPSCGFVVSAENSHVRILKRSVD